MDYTFSNTSGMYSLSSLTSGNMWCALCKARGFFMLTTCHDFKEVKSWETSTDLDIALKSNVLQQAKGCPIKVALNSCPVNNVVHFTNA